MCSIADTDQAESKINPTEAINNSETMMNRNKEGKVQSLFSNEMTDLDLAFDGTLNQPPSGKRTPTKKSSSYKKSRTKKPDGMPRRPLSAYNLFFKEQREIIIAERTAALPPDQLKGRRKTAKISFEELAKLIGGRWKAIDPMELQRFKSMAEEESRTYKIQMEQYLRKSGGQKAERSMSLPPMPTTSSSLSPTRGPPLRSNSSFACLQNVERVGAPVSAAMDGMDTFFRGMRNNTASAPPQDQYQVVSFDYRRSFNDSASYPPFVPSSYAYSCHPSSSYDQQWGDDASQGSSERRAPSPVLSRPQQASHHLAGGGPPLVDLQTSSAAMIDTLLDDAPLHSIHGASAETVTPESQREAREPNVMQMMNQEILPVQNQVPTDMSWMEPRPIAPPEPVTTDELVDFDPLDISAGLELDDVSSFEYFQ